MATYTKTTTTTNISTTTPINPVPPDSPASLTPLNPTTTSKPSTSPSLSPLLFLKSTLHHTLSLFVLIIPLLFTLSLLHHLFSFYTALYLLPPSSKLALLFHGSIAYSTFLIAVLVGDDLLKEVLGARGVRYGGIMGEVVITWALWVNLVVLVVVAAWVVGWKVVDEWKGWELRAVGWRVVKEMTPGLLRNVLF